MANTNKTNNTNIYVVGNNEEGQLATGNRNNIKTLQPLTNDINIMEINCGRQFIIYTTNKGEYYAVGWNEYGQF